MSALFSLDGKLAMITGASRGLGWAMAEAMAGHGAAVVLCGRAPASLDQRAAALRGRGLAAETAVFDVADRPAAAAALEAVVARHGRLDVLVNNAGIQYRAPLVETGDAAWDRVIETNLTAGFVLARAAARHMLARGQGRIINTVSILGPLGRATVAAYGAAKGGLAALTRALAVELGPGGITCTGIAPGYFATEMTQALVDNPEFAAFIERRVPLGRWGRPEEIAGAAVFLASAAGSYVNGHVLDVDGGLSVAV